jgi:hypothetical protein
MDTGSIGGEVLQCTSIPHIPERAERSTYGDRKRNSYDSSCEMNDRHRRGYSPVPTWKDANGRNRNSNLQRDYPKHRLGSGNSNRSLNGPHRTRSPSAQRSNALPRWRR